MKHLESFKSENIQSIYDFLEQDADVTNFKRDLLAVSEYKKIGLHDLEAELFQYAELMKEDLTDKIVFIFRDTGYLGIFSEKYSWEPIEHNLESYKKHLRTGDQVSFLSEEEKDFRIYGYIFIVNDGFQGSIDMYVIQDEYDGAQPPHGLGWQKYGEYSWIIVDNNILDWHKDLKKLTFSIPNLITDEKGIKELKETMHFALVI